MIYHSKTSQKKGSMAIIISEKYILKQRIFSWIKKKVIYNIKAVTASRGHNSKHVSV